MEASGTVFQRATVTTGERRLCGRRTRRVLGLGFTDAERLEKDLSAFYSMSFVVEPGVGLNEDAKSKMISDAANLLLTQLKELRVEEKQIKSRRKEEKGKSTKKNCSGVGESWSSSSSESSDSECETIAKMRKLERVALVNIEPETLEGMQQRSMIEVCMGGKCKKSSALKVLGEFEKKAGIEGVVVVGCKCMDKCRDGPNVRLVS